MIVAIYCRLSKEDEEKRNESESIQNQKSLLLNYSEEKGWFVYKIYCDEDYSGIDCERPAFKELINDASKGKFQIVLVKSQSRFTRDMEIVEKYIHGKFLEWGIRFISLVDCSDTDVKGNKKARQINGLINEWYLEDLSENIKMVLDNKRKQGQYIGSFATYGYKKDAQNKNKLVVDNEAAEVVREVFYLYNQGNGKQKIASILNERGILNPTAYKQASGLNYVNGSIINHYGWWNKTTVGRILHNEMYLGTMVQGKKRKLTYKSKKLMDVSPDDWVKVEGTHEAIINKSTFEKVQNMLDTKTRSDGTGTVHPLSGKVKCLDCGGILTRVSQSSNGNSRSYLTCKLYKMGAKHLCTKHSIRLDILEDLIKEAILKYIKNCYKINESVLNFTKKKDGKSALPEKEIAALECEVIKRNNAIKELYLDKASKLINQQQFTELIAQFQEDKKKFIKRIEYIKNEYFTGSVDEDMNFLDKMNDLLCIKKLSRELVELLIESIEVGEKNPVTLEQVVKINWLF